MSLKPALAIALATVLWLGGCATRAPSLPDPGDGPVVTEPGVRDGEIARGLASWYGERFHGRRTASGEVFDMNQLTAAHKTLPFGTLVRVRHIGTGKEVTVRINDRGPHVPGRIIDLSRAAASTLGIVQSGVGRVALFPE
ncbi:septal ring lytic transglycosylase RlpA family protein [Hydrogenophaga laconesensis]|uniref:Endolytic peptidoglycan transglycosylase RlpA n=1 Tax=Hydrogenophaga laconesensis TaxID=1805971 RepID=A0ABU1V785_9BURK|nr:rare lipoprotein A [Hydrogenophaga laconesensis]